MKISFMAGQGVYINFVVSGRVGILDLESVVDGEVVTMKTTIDTKALRVIWELLNNENLKL